MKFWIILFCTMFSSCAGLTPAQKTGVHIINCRYVKYVLTDSFLTPQQQQARISLVEQLNASLGITESCDTVGR